MSVVLINGSRIHYESFGRGDPIIFLHGWLGSWGFGDSEKEPVRYSVESYVEMVVAFMNELGIHQVPLVGHTLGAAVAAELAARHPSYVSKILAVGLPLTEEAINQRLLGAGPNEALSRFFWHRQRPYEEVEMGVPKTDRNAITESIRAVAQLRLLETLDSVDVLLLAVYGAHDNVIDPNQAIALQANHYSARALVLAGTHHFPMLDQSAKFSRLLHDFMDVNDVDGLQELTIKQEWRRRTR
jgi:pimeloyl-ACP methyl ester carboxylesterase